MSSFSFLGALFIAAVFMLLSVVGLLLVRRYADIEWLERHQEVTSYIFLMVGTMYGVLIGFAIFLVWGNFGDAGRNLEREANQVADLYRMSAVMPEPLGHNIRVALVEYVKCVLDDDFPAMAEGREAKKGWERIQSLWDVYAAGEFSTPKAQVYYAESLRRLNELSNYRRLRLFTSRGAVPALVWWLLVSGTLVLIALSYFFIHESIMSQSLMTAVMVGILAFSIYLIYAFDSPFAGAARVSPQPFEIELKDVLAHGEK